MAREPKNLRVDSCETWYLSHTYDNTQVVTSRAPNSPGGTKVGGANPNHTKTTLLVTYQNTATLAEPTLQDWRNRLPKHRNTGRTDTARLAEPTPLMASFTRCLTCC